VKKVVYEIHDPESLLDTEEGLWHLELRLSTVDDSWDGETYDYGDVAVFKTRQYLDAERAGYCGYVSKTVELPAAVVLEAADAIRSGQVPRSRHDHLYEKWRDEHRAKQKA
jgi:hypothetical protein